MTDYSVRILPLGGLGEIGKNCLVIECGDDLIIIDAGLKFPEQDMLGIDYVIPDFTYIYKCKERVRAIFITHGHEDHVGALPYILPDLNVPVYTTLLTRGLIAVKLREHGQQGQAQLRLMAPGDIIKAGCFTVEPFTVTHSIPDCVGLAIDTPAGLIVHTGDFKFDDTPVYGPPMDVDTVAAFGRRGVRLLLSDCVRVENRDYTPSERVVGETLDAIVRERSGRIIIATFASNISRVQQAIDVAGRYGRRAGVIGRSMASNCNVATELGFLKSNNTLLPIEELRRLPPHQVLLVSTGSQGEPGSALSRMAAKDHRQIQIGKGDTVIISATPIPGNEETIARTIDNLLRQGAEVIYEALAKVHVSGHAGREELRDMIELLQPSHCVPIHGEYRHMVLYRQVAIEAGIPPENVHLIEVGDVLSVEAERIWKSDTQPVGAVIVDGINVGGTSDIILRDRLHLSRDGIVIAVVTLDRNTGELLAGPEIVTRGLPEMNSNGDLTLVMQAMIAEMIEQWPRGEVERVSVVQRIREELREFTYRDLRCRPMILPVVTEI